MSNERLTYIMYITKFPFENYVGVELCVCIEFSTSVSIETRQDYVRCLLSQWLGISVAPTRSLTESCVLLYLRDAARKLDSKTCLTTDAEDLIASAQCVAQTRSRTWALYPSSSAHGCRWRRVTSRAFFSSLEAPVTIAFPEPKPQQQVTWRPSTLED